MADRTWVCCLKQGLESTAARGPTQEISQPCIFLQPHPGGLPGGGALEW